LVAAMPFASLLRVRPPPVHPADLDRPKDPVNPGTRQAPLPLSLSLSTLSPRSLARGPPPAGPSGGPRQAERSRQPRHTASAPPPLPLPLDPLPLDPHPHPLPCRRAFPDTHRWSAPRSTERQ